MNRRKTLRYLDERLDSLKAGEILEITMPKEKAKFLGDHITDSGYKIISEYNDKENNSEIYHIKSIDRNKNA